MFIVNKYYKEISESKEDFAGIDDATNIQFKTKEEATDYLIRLIEHRIKYHKSKVRILREKLKELNGEIIVKVLPDKKPLPRFITTVETPTSVVDGFYCLPPEVGSRFVLFSDNGVLINEVVEELTPDGFMSSRGRYKFV